MKVLDFLLDFIFPSKCIFCNEIMPHGKGEYVCSKCVEKIVFCENELCYRCGKTESCKNSRHKCF